MAFFGGESFCEEDVSGFEGADGRSGKINDAVNDEFSLDSFEADFRILLTDTGYGVLVENVELDRFEKLDGVRGYILSIVNAVRDSAGVGNMEARVDSAHSKRVPSRVMLRLNVLLRSHGIQLKQFRMFEAQDTLYWGSKLLK